MLIVALVLSLALGARAMAQQGVGRAAPTPGARASGRAVPSLAGYLIEREVRERWVYGGQSPDKVFFYRSQHGFGLDSAVDAGPRQRTFFLRREGGGWPLAPRRLVVDGHGRAQVDAEVVPDPSPDPLRPEEDARLERMALYAEHREAGRLSLPQTHLWDVVPGFHPASLRPGERWSDPVAARAAFGDFRQEIDGRRVSVLLGDTVVDSRRLWLVRESAMVRYRERAPVEAYTPDALALLEREASGTIRGRYLYDPELRLATVREDTTALVGTARLRLPDGRAYRTPARFERRRHTAIRDPAWVEARRRAPSGWGDVRPRTEVERRLSAGDTLVRDSLLARWRVSLEYDEQARIARELLSWGRPISELAPRPAPGPMDALRMRQLLADLADPGAAFAAGRMLSSAYEDLRSGLLSNPPAGLPDTAAWPCTPEACRLLASEWERRRSPRLRTLGLIAHLTLDPARWADTVLAQAAIGRAGLDAAVRLVRGASETAPEGLRVRVPPPGADWRAWRDWSRWRAPGSSLTDAEAQPGWGRDAPRIRVFGTVSDRDIVSELRTALRQAATDSARWTYELVLMGWGEYVPDTATVQAHLASTSRVLYGLGRQEFSQLLERAPAADSATAAELLDRALGVMAGTTTPWPRLRGPDVPERAWQAIRPLARPGVPLFIADDSLPASVRAAWRARATVLPAAEWRRRFDRQAGLLLMTYRVARAGPFASVRVIYSVRAPRPDDPTLLYAGWGAYSFDLAWTETGWVLVGFGEAVS
jgi:hypothetical protein